LIFKNINGREKPIRNLHRLKVSWSGDSRSKFQKKVKDLLYPYWKYDLVYEEFPIPSSRMSIDFYNHTKKIAIEVQGKQHIAYVEHFHKSKANFLRQIKRDFKKIKFCEINGIRLIEIYPDDELSDESFAKLFF
jgi:hypothetical protein